MTYWPTVIVHNKPLKLPALAETLERLVHMTVCVSGEQRAKELNTVLDEDPFLLVWLTAQAALRGHSVNSSLNLSRWMFQQGEQAIAELDPDLTDELVPPDPENSAAYVCQLVSTSSETGKSLCSLVNTVDPEISPGDEQVANHLMKLMNSPSPLAGPRVHFADWQKVLNWDQREEAFASQLQHQKMLAVKNFAYGAGHEINNPLANISSRAQRLVSEEKDPERRRILATIETQAHRASAMIADLMLFAVPPDIKLVPNNVQEMISKVVEEMAEYTDPKGLIVEVASQGDVLIQADRSACMEMFKAVIQNSIDAMEVGKIKISWEVNNDALVVVIEDDGPGIPEDQVPIVFDPFFSGREAGRGIGFGLTKAWRIMQLHHGDIQVENREPGVATRMQFVTSPV